MSSQQYILSLTDRCVKCGLCLPQCPTYVKNRNESESPRGRIALMQAVAEGQLDADATLMRHLDNCLLCRRCERVCPSGMQYGAAMDETRYLLKNRRPPSRTSRLELELLGHPRKLKKLTTFLRIYQNSGLAFLWRHSGLLRRGKLAEMDALLPPPKPALKLQRHYPAQGQKRGRVALFHGCLGQHADAETLSSTLILLTRLGYEVEVPAEQNCCGALHQHQGEKEQALMLAKQNLRAFAAADIDAIIYTASGCGAQLMEYAQLTQAADESEKQAEDFTRKLMDIDRFLAQAAWPEDMRFAPLPKQALLHIPCSQRNVLREQNYVATLLARIPELKLTSLPESVPCCGAGGDYMLRHAEEARALREETLALVKSSGAELLLTTNLGCALFMAAGLSERDIRVVHPVTLLAEQLQ